MRSLSLLAVLLACACTVNLHHDLNEEDANDIYVLLTKAQIDTTKVREGEGKDARYVIAVPKADVERSAGLLKKHSLPRPHADGLGIFKSTKGMIPTQTEERAMLLEALAGEVSNALNRVPGILDVRTIVMIPENNDLTQPEKRPAPSASVLLTYLKVEGKVPVQERDIQEFVSRAVPELKVENVKVMMNEQRLVMGDENEDDRIIKVLGIRVDRGSAGTLKGLLAVFSVLFLLMAGLTAFFAVRKPKSNGKKPRPTPEG
jgi:type III secretion protein J